MSGLISDRSPSAVACHDLIRGRRLRRAAAASVLALALPVSTAHASTASSPATS